MGGTTLGVADVFNDQAMVGCENEQLRVMKPVAAWVAWSRWQFAWG